MILRISANVQSGSPGRFGMFCVGPAEQFDEAIDAVGIAGADIDDFAREIGASGGHESVGDIGHEGEIARLRSIPDDGEGLARKLLREKHAEHRAVSAGRAMARAVDVEQPQRHTAACRPAPNA